MSDTPDMTSCIPSDARDGALSAFFSLSYHFGMLLGVDDFATEQSYHRGKMRLHNSWLHGAGVVWGFNVLVDKERGEVRVKPGLALDGAGRELHLEGDACVNVGEWLQAQIKKDPSLKLAVGTPFDAHVEVRFNACATRQVPALLEPCAGAGSGGTAYSRVFETVDLRLVPGRAPRRPLPQYRALRVLFGLQKPGDDVFEKQAATRRLEIMRLAPENQPEAYLEALRRFAPTDEIELHPDDSDPKRLSLFPAPDDTAVMLANIEGLTVKKVDDHWSLTAGRVDITVRPVLIPTATIQELLCGPVFGGSVDPRNLTGPRVTSAEITDDKTITLHLDKKLKTASVQPAALSVTTFDDTQGWADVAIDQVKLNDPTTIAVTLNTALAADARVRLIARGTGPKPILGEDYAPLLGSANGPYPIPNDGIDFVFNQKRRQ